MIYRVVLSPRAEAQLDEVYRHIRAWSGEGRAGLVVTRLLEACKGLQRFPMRGNARDDLFPGLRVMGYRRQATIAFTVERDTVTVHGVLWRGRDINALLASEPEE